MCSDIRYEMEKILNDMHWKLEQAELDLKNKIKQLDEKNIQAFNFFQDNREHWFRTIVNYMANGLTYTQAFQLLTEEEKIDRAYLEKVFSSFNAQRKITEMYAKVYMIKKLVAANFTNKQISEIMKISISQIIKLKKCKLVIPK